MFSLIPAHIRICWRQIKACAAKTILSVHEIARSKYWRLKPDDQGCRSVQRRSARTSPHTKMYMNTRENFEGSRDQYMPSLASDASNPDHGDGESFSAFWLARQILLLIFCDLDFAVHSGLETLVYSRLRLYAYSYSLMWILRLLKLFSGERSSPNYSRLW